MNKKLHTIGTLVAILGLGLGAGAATAAPVATQHHGSERFDGSIVTSGVSGSREVLSNVIRLKGVFNGVGRIVEQPSRPGDPENVDRDDLVFPAGTLHIASTDGKVLSFRPNPQNCTASGTMQKATKVVGGTGRFAGAAGSFAGTVSIHARVGRKADGSCNFNLDVMPLHEVDTVSGSGTLSF